MSELSDKIAYIKGLCAGIDFSTDTPEGKLLMAIVDALGSVKDELDAVRDDHEELAEYVQPVGYKIIPEMPMTPIGKFDYRKLEEEITPRDY